MIHVSREKKGYKYCGGLIILHFKAIVSGSQQLPEHIVIRTLSGMKDLNLIIIPIRIKKIASENATPYLLTFS